jgi:hypothetical protein
VGELTDVSRPSDGNRAFRKSLDCAHLAKASPRAKTIKLADLINNCRDICAQDPEFGRVYLIEMASLLEVLGEGDRTLFDTAIAAMHTGAKTLNLPLNAVGKLQDPGSASEHDFFPLSRMAEQFRQTFTARNITRTLPSVDHPPSEKVLAIMERHNVPAVGIRREGVIRGYVTREDPLCEQEILPGQILVENASFSEVILALSRHDLCFVQLLDAIAGIIVKDDIQHPYMRMWLFGIVTMLEMETGPMIERFWPDDTWKSLVSPGRLAKAGILLEERTRRKQQSTLLACLQFSDKMQILVEHEKFFQMLGFPSKKVAGRICKELESLRNNLAHAQDIVTHDFAQVARIAQRIESARSVPTSSQHPLGPV